MRCIYCDKYLLYVGSEDDLPVENMYIISAAKEPYHREALGYTTQSAPKDHPEYLWAYRENRLILNLVDARTIDYIPKCVIDEAIKCIDRKIQETNIFLHCNAGISRSPSIGLLYLATNGKVSRDVNRAIVEFQELYPDYCPSNGILDFIHTYWKLYHRDFNQGVELLNNERLSY